MKSKKKKKNLTIISVPFVRLKRILLFPDFINSLSEYSDILIVAPFENKNISYKKNNSIFYYKLDNKLSKFQSLIYNFTESLRVIGYFRREKNNGLNFWYKELFLNISTDGEASKKSISKRLYLFMLSLLGSIENLWIFFDRLFGKFIFQEPALFEISKNYINVSIIQSANWGFDDRKLSWLSMKQKWKKLLIPYTTDQLMCTGYLISNFDYICVQGPKEFFYSRSLHKIPPNKIIKFGSLLYRHIDIAITKSTRTTKKINTILWAGVSKTYFPLKSQIRIVEHLCSQIENNNLPNTQLILRPFLLSKLDLQSFIKKFENNSYVKFQLPELTNYALQSSGSKNDFLNEFKQYIKNMSEIDLLIMPGITTMVLEASYLGTSSIFVFDDPTKNLEIRNYNSFFKKNGNLVDFNEFKNVKCVHKIEELSQTINNIFKSKNKLRKKEIVQDWDYPHKNYKEKLKNLINN